jgi:hypothetical protein
MVDEVEVLRFGSVDHLQAALVDLNGNLAPRLSDVHVQCLCEEVGGEGVLQLGVFDRYIGEDRFLAKDVVKVSFVPDILAGKVLSEIAVTVSSRDHVKGKLLVFSWRQLYQKITYLIEYTGKLFIIAKENVL